MKKRMLKVKNSIEKKKCKLLEEEKGADSNFPPGVSPLAGLHLRRPFVGVS